MLIRIRKASRDNYKPCKKAYLAERKGYEYIWMVNIESLEDLKEINRECEVPLIVNFFGDCKEIVIYDDYIE